MITATLPLSTTGWWVPIIVLSVVCGLVVACLFGGELDFFRSAKSMFFRITGAIVAFGVVGVLIGGFWTQWTYQSESVSYESRAAVLTEAVEKMYAIDVLEMDPDGQRDYTVRAVQSGSTIGIECTLTVTSPDGQPDLTAGVTCPLDLPLRSAS